MGIGMASLNTSPDDAALAISPDATGCYATCNSFKRICKSNCPPMPPCSLSLDAAPVDPADQASDLLQQMRDLLLAIKAAGQSTLEQRQTFTNIWQELRVIVGPDPHQFWADALSREYQVESKYTYEAPDRRLPYVATQTYDLVSVTTSGTPPVLTTNRVEKVRVTRGTTDPFGQFQVFPPAPTARCTPNVCNPEEYIQNWRLEVFAYDATTRRLGRALGFETSGKFGGSTTIQGTFAMYAMTFAPIEEVTTADADVDGLPDLVEAVYGTNPANPDSDGDGLLDGAEVDQGLNPLDGRPMAIGVIGSVPTPGPALDIATFNDRAVLALGDSGVGVMDIAIGKLGVLIARLDAPGEVRVVGLSQQAGAAGGKFAGLVAFDPQNPINSAHLISAPWQATAIAVAAGIGWIGTDGSQLVIVDLATGNVLDSVDLPSPAFDIALDGGVASVVTGSQLLTFQFSQGAIQQLGATALNLQAPDPLTQRRRLVAGDDIAFVTDLNGFGRFDLEDPSQLAQISTSQSYGPASFKQILPIGSGYGIAVVGGAPNSASPAIHNLQMFDLRNPQQNALAGDIIQTPGVARAASIYNGFAYVADGDVGMQIINYLASDTGTNAPSISLRTTAVEGKAEEGQLLRLLATVADDVQVRVVDFYLDGVRIASDGNFPFEVAFQTPLRTDAKTTITVSARATDTAGNVASTGDLVLELVPDATPPRFLRSAPHANDLLALVNSMVALFSEALDPGSLTEDAIQVRAAGADGVLGTGDDLILHGYAIQQRDIVPAVAITFTSPLAPASYRVTFTSALKDLVGNPLATPVNVDFLVFNGAIDSDGDGLPDDVERLLGTDPNKADSNGNGISDGNEDFDGDGLSNRYEIAFGLNPLLRDTDGNGIDDGKEDRDGDGLTELQEQAAGTNPLRTDTDGDGWSDEAEITAGSNPHLASSTPKLMYFAQPSLDVILPRADTSSLTLGVVLARPPVDVILPQAILGANFTLGTTLARPPIDVTLPGAIFAGINSFGTILAQPPIDVLLPEPVFTGITFGTIVARPPLDILDPTAATPSIAPAPIVANPPLSIDFSPQQSP
jgi:hypothetical protein